MTAPPAGNGPTPGGAELRAALGESRRLFVSIGLFSVFVNLLMLTGPLFMLQVYDRVLSTAEFGFVRLGDGFTTGSSLMPQKRNPDVAELTRGKSGRLLGNLTGILTVLKGLPAGYNRDLQEDRRPSSTPSTRWRWFCPAMSGALDGMTLVRARIGEALRAEMLATDLADHLVRRGVPFRESHHVAGALVRAAESSGRELGELTLEEMRAVHSDFGPEVFEIFDPAASVESRAVRGGTSAEAVAEQLRALERALAEA